MINKKLEVRREFEKLLESLSENRDFIEENKEECFRIFTYIYIINHFKNRAETKVFFNEEFETAFSLLIESVFVLYLGHLRAGLLILRSSQEMSFKSIIHQERKWILTKNRNITFDKLDYRFVENKNIFLKDIEPHLSKVEYEGYYKEIERTVTYYKELSGIVHSGNKKINFNISHVFESIKTNNEKHKEEIFSLFLNVLKNLFVLLCYMMRESLVNWDTYELQNVLSIVFKKEKQINNFILRFK